MLCYLTIKNYALIRDLKMVPAQHLNTITGETGAGKSILLGAMGLLLGNRADTKVLLNNKEKCIIEAEFDIKSYEIQHLFEEFDLDYEDQTIFRREISPAGKSRAFINDTPTTIDVLKQIGSSLVDIHSQHDTLLLGDSGFQLDVVDTYASNNDVLDKYRKLFRTYSIQKKGLDELKQRQIKMEKDREFNQFQYEELEAAGLISGEEEDLEKELSTLSHAEDIKEKISKSLNGLSENDFSILNMFSDVKNDLGSLSNINDDLEEISGRAQQLFVELKELIRDLEDQNDQADINPQRTEEIEERLSVLHNLKLKHRKDTVEELIQVKNYLGEALSDTANLDEVINKKQVELNKLYKQVTEMAADLSKRRKGVFKGLAKEIELILGDLAITEAEIKIAAEEIPLGDRGIDKIVFLFSANKGFEARELKKVASGGEFSRLMFAIKFVLASRKSMPTMIFDEIDTGISGEVALSMGKMMRVIGERQQVITITHLPQIAALGDKHYFVYKEVSGETTNTSLREIRGEERIEQIARMIAGDNPSSTAFESAKELLR